VIDMITIWRADHTTGALSTFDGISLLAFPGGEPHANVVDAAAMAGGSFLIDARVDSFNTFGLALVANDALRRCGAAEVRLFCPYLPGARQDRDAPLTAKLYADIINAGRFDEVIAVDAHSPVMPALLDRCRVVGSSTIVPAAMVAGNEVVVICPDAGAAKRAEAVADTFRLPVVFARKHRDPGTGRLSGFSCEALAPTATGVVIDDICDGGGTFLGLAEAIGLPREQLRLWTTHGIYSKGVTALHERFSMIGCTDSFPTAHLADVDLVVPLFTHPTIHDMLNRTRSTPS
jgi:ribose-phosphate pyrophosphokinase